jgi:hypothetical protein
VSGKHRRPDPADAEPAQPPPAPAAPPVQPPPPVELEPEPEAEPGPGAAPERVRSAEVGATVVARPSRAATRAARRRALHRRLLAGGLALALVAGAAVTWWLVAGRDERPAPTVRTVDAAQRTLLVQLADADGQAAATALLGLRGTRTGAVLFVPSRLVVDVAGAGAQPFGETLTLPDPAAPGKALTDLTGVRVDGDWVLEPVGLAGLVDAVGGVQAEVDVDVTTEDAQGRRTLVVRAGQQRLGGAAAAAYAGFAAPEEPELARLARFNDVLDGVLRGLPPSAGAVERTLAGLGERSRSTLPVDRLAARLVDARAAVRAGGVLSDVLPVREIDSGGDQQAYGIDAGRADALIRSRFAGALTTPSGAVRVLVENGVGRPGLVDAARSRLVAAGLRFVNGGNAAEFDSAPTVILIPDATARSQQQGDRVAGALGLPKSSVQVSGRGQTVAEVIVILGADFRA